MIKEILFSLTLFNTRIVAITQEGSYVSLSEFIKLNAAMDTKTDGKATLNNEAPTLRRVYFPRAAAWLCLQEDGDV